MKPLFPIYVYFKEDGDTWILENEIELATNLEWFDSSDSDENAIVKDKLGRIVQLKVKNLEIILFELN